MPRSKNKIISAILTASLFIGLSFAPAQGQETLKVVLKEILDGLNQIEKIKKDPSLDKEKRSSKETLARKEVLLKIFELTLLENEDLKLRLLELDNLEEKTDKIRNGLLISLKENERVFELLRERFADIQTLSSFRTEQLAVDFKNWRSLVYNPKAERAVAFISIFQQKKIMSTAQGRLDKIKTELEQLGVAALAEWAETKELLQKAEAQLREAEIFNTQAERITFSMLASKLFFIATTGDSITLATIKTLSNESWQRVQAAYGFFKQIGESAKEKTEQQRSNRK